jgi:SAM-dependent methyltransferase
MEHGHEHEHGMHDRGIHDDGDDGADSHALAQLLDHDAEVLRDYLAEVTAWVRRAAADIVPRRRVLDLGAGTGSGTIALARLFGSAEVLAVDRSEAMLGRVRAKALELGLAGRVRTLRADLNAAWPDFGAVDVAWASNALHELADPDRAFKDLFAAIRPGGLLAVAEMDALPRFLPEQLGLGRDGLEARCHEALERSRPAGRPRLGPDWGPYLERAGFAPPLVRVFAIDLAPPHPASTGRYARAYLQHVRPLLQDVIDGEDLDVVDTLLDDAGPHSLLRRGDLHLRGARTVWLARRP